MKNIHYTLPLISIVFFLLSAMPSFAQNARTYNEIGNKVLSEGDYEKAIEYYNKAIRLNPYNGIYYLNRGNAFFNNGDYQRANSDYSKAIRYYRNDPQTVARLYYQRGLCSYILNDYYSAVHDFTSAIAMRPNDPDPYYFRGKIQKMVFSRHMQARKDFEKVVRVGNKYSISSAFAYFFLGDEEEAKDILKRLLSESQNDREEYANVCYNVGGFYGLLGQEDRAVYYLEYALKNGFNEFEWLKRDINFDKIRYTHAFKTLVKNMGSYHADPVITHTPNQQNNSNNAQSPSAPAYLTLTQLEFADTDGNNSIDAGETTYISFTLVNNGRGAATEMELVTEEVAGMTGLGYTQRQTLGTLNAGEQRDFKIQVNGGQDIKSGKAEFKIMVRERYGFDSQPVRISIPTREYMPPKVEIVDHHFTTEVGGKMRLGIPINLKIAVQNLGQGEAEGVVLSMKLPENVFSAGESRFVIGNLKPGESEVIDFEFFTNRRYDEASVSIYGELKDGRSSFVASQVMTVGINQELEVDSRVIVKAGGQDPVVDINQIRLRSDVDSNLPRSSMNNPNAVAVIIGNRDYLNADVPAVDFALHDAKSMKRYLIEVFGYDENNIIMLNNATQADFNGTFGTKESHKARLYNLVKAGKSDVFVYYSGHGAPDLEKNEGYFVPVDCDPSLVKFNGYSIKTFYENLSKISYNTLTVVIDACFSGSSDKGTLMPATSLARIKSETGVLNDPNAVVFTSASGDQVSSWYPEQYHSLFTYYFLKGIQESANNDRNYTLTLGELRAYIAEEVPYMARRLKNRIQTPEVYGKDQTVLIKY